MLRGERWPNDEPQRVPLGLHQQPPDQIGHSEHNNSPSASEGNVPGLAVHGDASQRRQRSSRRRRGATSLLQRQQQRKRLPDAQLLRRRRRSDVSPRDAAVHAGLLPELSQFPGIDGKQDADGVEQPHAVLV